MIDLRQGGKGLGGAFTYNGPPLVTGWHRHDLHQIEYAVSGVIEVETAAAHYLLPPQQAAWIPAGLEHSATMNSSVRSVAVLFDPSLISRPGDRTRIIAVPPLIREMVIYAQRWPIGGAQPDPVADGFFRTLGHLVTEALDQEAPLDLPTPADPLLAAAAAHTRRHLAAITVEQVSRAVGVSERTLRRQFRAELGLSWRDYLTRARLLRAMALLAETGPSVLEVSTAVGFDSPSSFARAFTRHCGESPSDYRRRVASRT
ncbi:helix-turn-helix transcriptional regulator [Frankia sp. R82]|uniref:helix-turn-helix domain-containing protein n=1 Tax=Frankia sp. R82 TaxID=2950553 RepID=UPI002043CDE5|nr:helix-turn-helix transcriptional regulator [Frankia sp. R82]MCM3882570.1 helix-turn-helix transcriptional regulator [Frankia sp. R82]